MNNLLSYCGLVDTKIRASEKDLPVLSNLYTVVSVDSYQDPSENWQQGSTKKSMNTSCCIYMSSTI